MKIDFHIVEAAARRWHIRQEKRELNQQRIRTGRIADIESQERITKRMRRLSSLASQQAVGAHDVKAAYNVGEFRRSSHLVESIGFERVIGKDDFLGIDFLEMALAVSRFVGRVQIRARPGRAAGFGTGFMVSERLLLTNNHVLKNKQMARHSEVEFDYQYDRNGRLLPVVPFALKPESFFITDPDLDFTLVAVAEKSVNHIDVARYGWSRLVGEQGKALLGDSLNIIQHPRGEAKQIVLRSNELIDLFEDFGHYVTDTEPCSSGSPVYNDQWEVVALHHSGVPRKEGGHILTKGGSTWQQGMDPDLIDWIANEGIRVSSIVRSIRDASIPLAWEPFRRDLLEKTPPHPMEAAARAPSCLPSVTQPSESSQFQNDPGAANLTVPLQVRVSFGTPKLMSDESFRPETQSRAVLAEDGDDRIAGGDEDDESDFEFEAVSIDPDYSSRMGYEPEFLGRHDREVPLPKLTREQLANTAVNRQADNGESHVLPYHHFSVVMNRSRRLAWLTAVNIDGRQDQPIRRERDRWFHDPRIGRDEQLDHEIYARNPLDRSHWVRRLDPAWGESSRIAKAANDDTFHWTNCCPQHEGFNCSGTLWGGLEDYILRNAKNRDLRVSVFTGPVLKCTDPPYREIQLPLEYWKIVAMVKHDGEISATAYLLSQSALIDELPQESFQYGAYKTFQVTVAKVARLTGFDFGDLAAFDPIESEELFGLESARVKEVSHHDELIL
ncbi:MAG: DNA/RNA non-specific endonuclease [Phycisphaerales bacterium]|nr:DNA/RNA non-specific endonuclease [Phycisphaerales bacterium]